MPLTYGFWQFTFDIRYAAVVTTADETENDVANKSGAETADDVKSVYAY